MHHPLPHLDELDPVDIGACIILTPEGGPSPDTLARMKMLECEFIVTHDELLAWSHLLLSDRLNASRASWGLQAAGPALLIVERPSMWADLGRLLDGVRVNLSGAAIAASTGAVAGGGLDHPYRRPAIDPAGEADAEDDRFVSSEELAMLLGRDEERDQNDGEEGGRS